MKPSQWQVAAQTRDLVGEGPVWVAAESALYWVDVTGRGLNRLSLGDGSVRQWAMPEPIGFIVSRRNKPGFIAGFKSGFYVLQISPYSRQLIGNPYPDLPDNRLNDGKVDASGRLWAGSMAMTGDVPTGTLYRLDSDHSWHEMDSGYCVTNGPAFSPDHQWLYHSDSPRRVIYRFRLDRLGMIDCKTTFVQFPNEWGYPDGMTVDAEGCLWVAHWDGGRISRFDPDGKLDRAITLPVPNITSCAFAGDDLDRLFVTSARAGSEENPLAGALFEVWAGAKGLQPGAFAG